MSGDDLNFDLGIDPSTEEAPPRRYDFLGRPQDDGVPAEGEPSLIEAAILEFIDSLQSPS